MSHTEKELDFGIRHAIVETPKEGFETDWLKPKTLFQPLEHEKLSKLEDFFKPQDLKAIIIRIIPKRSVTQAILLFVGSLLKLLGKF